MKEQPFSHEAVLLNEAVEALVTDPNGIYVDGTFGRGGHSQHLLNQLGEQGRLLAIDKDPEAIVHADAVFAKESRFIMCHGSFAQLQEFVEKHYGEEKITGVLLDLGVSSPQLDDANRGFSFMHDGPLDMRMDNSQGQSVAQWLALAKEEAIVDVLKTYGEERFAKRIASSIVQTRLETKIDSTVQLARLIDQAVPFREKHKHPATRSFQALRIFINKELDDVEQCLHQALSVLKPEGRMAVISFHSLEDRIVKRFIQTQEKGDDLPPDFPVRSDQLNKKMKRWRKPIKATAEQVRANVRARSAILRVAVKL